MMSREERKHLARSVCARMVPKYPDHIIVAGVCGSTAQGSDTPWSDIELVFVVRDGSTVEAKQFIYRGTAVGLIVIEQNELEKLLTDLTALAWEYWMGVLSTLSVLEGDPERVRAWLSLGRSVPAERFREALEASLPALVTESYGRILSCRECRDSRGMEWVLTEFLSEMKLALCLLNQRWATHTYYEGLVDTFSFPKLPKGYRELVPALWSARDLDEVVTLAETLAHNFWQLLRDQGIKIPTDYQAIGDLPL